MSRWKTGEKLIDEVESDWRKRIDNCAQRAIKNTRINSSPVISKNINRVQTTAQHEAKSFLSNWLESDSLYPIGIGYSKVESEHLLDDDIYDDLALTVAGVGSKIGSVDKIHSAGDFIDSYLERDYSKPVEDTEDFINQLLKKDIPIKTELQPKTDFRKSQKARQNALRDKMDRRKEEARIRLEAQKAARVEEAKSYEEKKRREAKKRLEEERLLEAEIQKMRKDLEKQRINTEKVKQSTRKEIIKRVHQDQQQQRKLHDEKMKRMQAKFHLEAKNKIIIEQRIKKFENERIILLKKCFEKWSQVLIHRRKQQGTAAAFYDWRITKRAFVRWKRFTRVETENRIVHLEKTKAKRIEIYKSTLSTRKNHILLAKYFNSWRLTAKRNKEIEKLKSDEKETQAKMANLLQKLKSKSSNEKRSPQNLEVENIEDEEISITPIKAWDGPVQRKHLVKPQPPNVYKNRHLTQKTIIEAQKNKINEHETRIEELLQAKLTEAREEILEIEKSTNHRAVVKSAATRSRIPPQRTIDSRETIKSVLKPHQSVLNMKKRESERAERKKALEERKRQKELERQNDLRKKHEDELKKIEIEKKAKRQEFLEKEKIEHEKKEKRRQNLLKFNENLKIATNHYQLIVIRRGFDLFRKHKMHKDKIGQKIRENRDTNVTANVFKVWRQCAIQNRNKTLSSVTEFRSKWLLKRYFHQWTNILKIDSFNIQKADEHYKSGICVKMIKTWSDAAIQSKLNEWRLNKYADAYYTKSLLKKAFSSFAKIKMINHEEQERQNRKLKLKALIKEVVPDFK